MQLPVVSACARAALLFHAVNGMQKLHQVFMKARSQVMFGLYPCTADFILFRPDSTYTFEDAGPWPWSVQQLDTVLSSHTACVASYLQTLSAEVLNMCCGHDVRQALLGAEANDLLPGDPLDKNMLGLLLRSSIQMRAACLDMVLASAQAFAHALGRDATDQVMVLCCSCSISAASGLGTNAAEVFVRAGRWQRRSGGFEDRSRVC